MEADIGKGHQCGPGDGGKSVVPESLCPLDSSLADRGAKTTVKKVCSQWLEW
jgi:hypothetical protein